VRAALWILAVAAASGIAWGSASWLRDAVWQQPGPLAAARDIVVPRGTTNQIADGLAADGLIDRPWLFRAAVWMTRRDGPLHAAEFAFPAHASMGAVMETLRTAHPVEHHLTIPEGLTALQITAIIRNAEAMQGEVPPIREGDLLPQTYDYEYGALRSRLVARAKTAMRRALTSNWAGRAPDVPLQTPEQALILASIVERETAKPEERPHVAAVYLNRLQRGMRLQADPTVAYAASAGSGVLDHPLTRAELDRDDPFNTYRTEGLPPTPICAPGESSLQAVLHPATSDDLFFVADGSGGHNFSRNIKEHDAAVARWRAMPKPGSGTD
jgi:UPF0755 protein